MAEKSIVSVKNISKDFYLPHEKSSSIKGAFTSMFRSKDRSGEMQHALKDVSFDIAEGEFFGILGRNGSGKSTLLKILAGIYTPTEGSIKTQGRVVPFIELGVGFNPELTGRENVFLNGALLGFSKKQVEARYDEIVAFSELEQFMDQKLKNYSSGMQVRLAFAVAVTAEADILLVDEVLAVGDADFQRKCFKYFKSLKNDKKTVVFVSHDMNAVREYCDRAVLINESEVYKIGPAERISQEYLKLFNDEDADEDSQYKDESELRWGNHWAYYTSVDYKLTDSTLKLELELIADRDLNDVIYGFRLRNDEGEEILGTNSKIKGMKNLKLKKGEKQKLTWEIPNILSNGKYHIEPALQLGDSATVCDWWNEAKTFDILKKDSTSYPSTPPMTLKVEKLK